VESRCAVLRASVHSLSLSLPTRATVVHFWLGKTPPALAAVEPTSELGGHRQYNVLSPNDGARAKLDWLQLERCFSGDSEGAVCAPSLPNTPMALRASILICPLSENLSSLSPLPPACHFTARVVTGCHDKAHTAHRLCHILPQSAILRYTLIERTLSTSLIYNPSHDNNSK
jgi:hypothetical protein